MVKAEFAKCNICTLNNNDCVLSNINQSKICLVGEAPGWQEVEQGEYFVGKAGDILAEILKELKTSRYDFNILNSVICRPTLGNKNRTPNLAEIDCCRDRLFGELNKINPNRVVALGKVAYIALGGSPYDKMSEVVGKKFISNNYEVYVTYHPASIIYDQIEGNEKRAKIKEIIKSAMEDKIIKQTIVKQLHFKSVKEDF